MMNKYLVTGVLVHPETNRTIPRDRSFNVVAKNKKSAKERHEVNGWKWRTGSVLVTKIPLPICPDCKRRTKRHGDPTLSDGCFMDQVLSCDCGWCGVDSVALTDHEAIEFLAQVKPKAVEVVPSPKQLRLFGGES